ncbi:hypothetical protein F5Y14DRAFT_456491 [Nemania sp. NC0429]|nr:hypothetical protein F5Y14DRAFT_456491 [Nemania sp. NC0429]
MHYSLDGNGLSREQLQAKAEAEAAAIAGQLDGDPSHDETASPRSPAPNSACEWRGDAPEPELDDLAHPPEQSQQPSRPANTCDWRGDEPEPEDDDLARIFHPDDQAQQSDRRDEQVKEADDGSTAEPREAVPSSGVMSPQSVGELHIDCSLAPEPPVGDENKTKESEQKKKKTRAERASGTSATPSRAANQSPAEGKTHSPWVDSLERMPATMMEKVNMGVKQTLEAATSRLSPSARKQPRSGNPNTAPKTRRTSGLAPESAAPPPPDFYISIPAQPLPGQSADEAAEVDNKKQEREKKKSEQKARREARRTAREEKAKEKKDKRRQDKERRQKEKDLKKVAKKGGELPDQLLQGLRIDPGAEIPYDSRCDICTRSAACAMSSKKHDPKCTICAKVAGQETTNQFLQSSKIDLANLPSLDDLFDSITKLLRKENKTTGGTSVGGTSADEHGHIEEDLARHILLHVQDLATCGGEASLGGHKCNNHGQPGHLGRHGLDGNRDSPTNTESGPIVPSLKRSSGSFATSSSSEVDWWVQVLSPKDWPSSSHRPSSPPEVIPQLQR